MSVTDGYRIGVAFRKDPQGAAGIDVCVSCYQNLRLGISPNIPSNLVNTLKQ